MFVDWICFLYFSLVGTPVSLKWSWDAMCFSASCIRILSGLEECSLNTFLKRCRCSTKSLKQNKNKDFVTQRASNNLSREDTVSREWSERKAQTLPWYGSWDWNHYIISSHFQKDLRIEWALEKGCTQACNPSYLGGWSKRTGTLWVCLKGLGKVPGTTVRGFLITWVLLKIRRVSNNRKPPLGLSVITHTLLIF